MKPHLISFTLLAMLVLPSTRSVAITWHYVYPQFDCSAGSSANPSGQEMLLKRGQQVWMKFNVSSSVIGNSSVVSVELFLPLKSNKFNPLTGIDSNAGGNPLRIRLGAADDNWSESATITVPPRSPGDVALGSLKPPLGRQKWFPKSDINSPKDTLVDGADLAVVFAQWGTSGPQGDLNSDGIVDGADVGAVYNDWYGGDTPPFVYPRTASQAINAPEYYITSGVNQQAGLGDTDGYVITRQVVADWRSGALANNGIVLSILSDDEIVIFSKEYAPASPLQALKPVLIIKTN